MPNKPGADLQLMPRWAVVPSYFVMCSTMATALRIFGRWEVRGRRHVPIRGPLIVVSNHLHNADPPLLGASLPRRIHFMAKIELFQKGLRSLPVTLFGSFPVRRFEADLAALRTAQELLRDGEAICMLPEGHRNRHGTALQEPFPGAALIALRSGAPVLPVGITGTEQIKGIGILLKRPRITVTIGEPFLLPRTGKLDGETVRAASETIMRRIAALLPPEYQGRWADTAPPPGDTRRRPRLSEADER